MKSYHKIYTRKLRRKYYEIMTAVLGFLSVKFTAWFKSCKETLRQITDRPFRAATLRNQQKFPAITLVSSTREALKVLGNPEPSTKDIAEALKRADKVRGDGKLPTDPREQPDTKAEAALGLHRAMKRGVTEADLVRDDLEIETELVKLEEAVDELVVKLEEQKAERTSAE